jgi:hypothetical protein
MQTYYFNSQALAQCEHTLTEFGIEHREAVDDTAGAAKVQWFSILPLCFDLSSSIILSFILLWIGFKGSV